MLQQLTSSMKNRLQERNRKAYKRKRIPEDDGNNYAGKSKHMFSNRIFGWPPFTQIRVKFLDQFRPLPFVEICVILI
jgi:hypothetical protein